ncbi:hypothetical protein AJ80_08817 [Polytolypa hystricis UAMH7299]|uniref:Uncharacterized protein n=1 Tax=Polytolypa hystricis (strain UAMH7299) TaxID=1447883 RepID=A0A2B7X0Y6_POLH7|nr:hypothetical protein AJ80_08817 [Polytolypa hystricis UAMH7299]
MASFEYTPDSPQLFTLEDIDRNVPVNSIINHTPSSLPALADFPLDFTLETCTLEAHPGEHPLDIFQIAVSPVPSDPTREAMYATFADCSAPPSTVSNINNIDWEELISFDSPAPEETLSCLNMPDLSNNSMEHPSTEIHQPPLDIPHLSGDSIELPLAGMQPPPQEMTDFSGASSKKPCSVEPCTSEADNI